jgi:uncharacterized protein
VAVLAIAAAGQPWTPPSGCTVEVDAVLENGRGQVVGIETKAASTVRADDFKGLRRPSDKLGDDSIAGIVLHTGENRLRFGPKMRAIPVSAPWAVGA